ncbi:MAG: flagellar export chaperone FliS [Desulfobacterales bacterium]|nr:flagellar export chaperone FliS [Desulfobacterales bacterium]
MNHYPRQYQNTQVNTSSPEQLLIMLYDGAIRFVRQAQEAMAAGNRKTRLEKISKAMAIICELANTLDHGAGGEIAGNLDRLYEFMNRELLQANVHHDAERLVRVGEMLTGLRDTWRQAIEQVQAAGAAAKGKREGRAGAAADSPKSLSIAL